MTALQSIHIPDRLLSWNHVLAWNHLKSTKYSVYEGNEALLGKQLRYVPQNRINFTNQLTYSIFNFGYIFSYTGKTFVNEDNSGMVASFICSI